jgi:hypothetical protein
MSYTRPKLPCTSSHRAISLFAGEEEEPCSFRIATNMVSRWDRSDAQDAVFTRGLQRKKNHPTVS